MTFLRKLHENERVKRKLDEWGYTYGEEPEKLLGRQLPTEKIGMGAQAQVPDRFAPVGKDGGFDNVLTRGLAKAAPFPKMALILSIADKHNEDQIKTVLKQGFDKVQLKPEDLIVVRLAEDSVQAYERSLRNAPEGITCSVVIFNRQNKAKYEAIKRTASIERGLITQVVTSNLLMSPAKASGAAVKIGIQVAAKIGGEPWYVDVPLKQVMVCGYDTYHDTQRRGRSFGAFVASKNDKLSRWFSKADEHDRLDELSSHMAQNLSLALDAYHATNEKRYPKFLFIYRDGVGDGQIEHVHGIELKQVEEVVKQKDPDIKLTFVIVNKRIGARFYMKTATGFTNPPPGTVVDQRVTRKERYDFYLVSQSTRHGTVTPTYYNIIADDSGLGAGAQQRLAFKLCFLYYNWSGTVRVPAPCQYAHKLALLCGETLHAVPNARLDDRLHFL